MVLLGAASELPADPNVVAGKLRANIPLNAPACILLLLQPGLLLRPLGKGRCHSICGVLGQQTEPGGTGLLGKGLAAAGILGVDGFKWRALHLLSA